VSSRVVERGRMVWVDGGAPESGGDVKAQTRQVLERIDGLLASAGTDKSRLLTAQVRLSDMSLLKEHDTVWSEWVDRSNPPIRALLRAESPQPGRLVEVSVTALKH
jgi:enamine deaminase RidA (YjgF/YER057c/UK114 family)